jgi:hypothetical protein
VTRPLALLHRRRADDTGSNTTETVIWIAVLAAVALAVGAYFASRIWEAAQNVVFQ